MDAYAISLQSFEGPLDLLYHLIQKNEINIYDIPIAEITRQYMEYIRTWREFDMDVASEFIVMASKLMELKSRMLLPRAKPEADEEDPREALVRQLLEYKVFKEVSGYLAERQEAERGTLYKDPEYIPELSQGQPLDLDATELSKAFAQVFLKYRDSIELRDYSEEIVREVFTVDEKIAAIRGRFGTDRGGKLRFSSLFMPGASMQEIIVTFLAILELYKIGEIGLNQSAVFQEIVLAGN